MPLFQKSVLKRYIAELSQAQISNAYLVFQGIFNNPVKQENILNSKEEQYQASFIRDLFVNVFGYVLNPDVDYNLITEQKNEKDSKKADGAILDGLSVLAVIELKSTKTVDLSSVEAQAFGYKNNQQSCKYVITSNFKKLRFYIDNAVDFEEFDLFNLSFEQFNLLWICLSPTHLLKNIPSQIKEASNHQEENVTKKLYADYAKFRTNLFQNIILNNPNFDKLVIFKKTQKLLDRFLFLFFAEDRGLVSPNWTRKILQDWTDLKDKYDNYIPLYNRFRKNFEYLNTGYSGKDGEIFAYNGGLFAPDEILDCLNIDDAILYNGSLILSNYDFESEVDVNILGHIFEHSLNEIDEIQASLEEIKIEKVTKRKKDGVFYTPKYITKYIVENTVGVLCKEQKEKLEITDEEFEFIDAKANKKLIEKRKVLNQKIIDYRNWLLELKIVDPACGSGAFLNQALEFLIAEHTRLDELKATLLGGSLVLSDVENSILENNLYGVDINEEAVEIAKLSLWLRTARKGRKLNSLNQNLKCGNSLIDDVEVAGDKAFNWNNEFREVFKKGGFDVVIGNPPYGAKLEIKEKNYFSKVYRTNFPNYDTYGLFFEKSTSFLKRLGLLGFITPNTFLVIENGQKLRELLFKHFRIISFLETYNVFPDAVVEPITTILRNQLISDNCKFYTYLLPRNNRYDINSLVKIEFSFVELCERNDLIFNYKATKHTRALAKKVCSVGLPLNQLAKVTAGVKPYEVGKGNPKQSRETVTNKEYTSHSENGSYWRPLIRGTQIKRYSLEWDNEYIKYGEWLAAPRKESAFVNSKILIRRTDDKILSVLDEEKFIALNSAHCLQLLGEGISLKYILGILNSKLINWLYQHQNFHMVNKPLAEVKVIFIERLPIVTSKDESYIIGKVELIMSEIKKLKKLNTDFSKLLMNNLFNLKRSSIFERPLNLDSALLFFKELERQKIKLSLSEQAEWLQYFEEQKAKALAIKTLINQTDKEIDKMVYELYELTEEEINIVEGI
ncbi:MAG: restriction endonuclease subunit M [Sphingobacteriales bacterium]|nr:MAG: restriction endonuclease subunit M [Sphingobacteriales bacterium]